MSKEKTLVILSPGFPENVEDSACLPSQQLLVRSLNKNYPSLKIIVVAFQYPFIKKKYQWHGNEVICLNGKNRGGLLHLQLWLQVWSTLRKLKKENTIIGVYSFWCGECALLGSWFGRLHS